MWNIKNEQTKTNKKINDQTKQKQTCIHREQSGGYQRGSGRGKGELGKEDQLYGDRWKVNLWW